MYRRGRGVTRDAVISLMLNILASQQGDQSALSNRKVIEREMISEDIATAKRLASECADNNYKECGF